MTDDRTIMVAFTEALSSPEICVGSVDPGHIDTVRHLGLFGAWATCDRCGYQPFVSNAAVAREIVAAPHPNRWV